MEANLFQVFIKLQSDLIIRAIIIRRLNFKTKFQIEIEPKSSIINIISILKRDIWGLVREQLSLSVGNLKWLRKNLILRSWRS